MNRNTTQKNKAPAAPYLTAAGAWALAFGCSVGQGAFIMPGSTFLPLAGPVGSAIGIGLGAAVMLIFARNYYYMMNRFQDNGGTYSYTKNCFGYDNGFVSAWFLILTYMAIIWANATALPVVARTLLGSTFQFGFHYQVAGFEVWYGEILLALITLLLAAGICLRKMFSQAAQILMSALLLCGILVCFIAAMLHSNDGIHLTPAFSDEQTPFTGTLTVFALSPWAFSGFESISHSVEEAKFPVKRSFRIFFAALLTGAAAYICLIILAATALPEGAGNWPEYVRNLGNYQGMASQPTFFAAYSAMGMAGRWIIGLAVFFAIMTGMVGNMIALSRLSVKLAEDGMIPAWLGRRDADFVPKNAVVGTVVVSLFIPFLGRTAISWIVDVTTVGVLIAYGFTSACVIKTAKEDGDRVEAAFGGIGLVIAALFMVEFMVPNIVSVTTLATESYLILSVWCVAGLLVFRFLLIKDHSRRFGRSILALVILLGVIIFTSTVWMRQDIQKLAATFARIDSDEVTRHLNTAFRHAVYVQVGSIVFGLLILFDIYSRIQTRVRQTEVEKAVAEDASRAKTSFLSNMSHEIRTPMNAIIGLNRIALRNPELPPETKVQLEKIGASAQHLLGLINDILDMSRIESGRMVLKQEEFSLRELVDQVSIMVQGQCDDKGLTYECRIDGDVHDYYVGDDMKLKQVLINILGNSVKFTEKPGRVTLTVEEISEANDFCVLRFSMADTGVGMDEEYIPKIFEAFSQENATSTNKYGGTGLGMAITKNFVTMMNGDIQVESEKGAGSVFIVTVSLGLSGRIRSERDETGLSGGTSSDRSYGLQDSSELSLAGRRVLIAEDVEQNAEILEDLLDIEDILNEHAENGQAAVTMFAEHPEGYYDVILMDVRMPVMDGLAAARAIRAMDRPDAGTIPIIAMTANVFEEDIEQTRQAGMDAHLAKPIEPDVMYETMARMIGKS